MNCRTKGFIKANDGTSALEFAIIAPVLFLFLFGIIEISRMFWTDHVLNETAIRTARCMALPQLECTKDGAFDLVSTTAFAMKQADDFGVSLTPGAIQLNRAAKCFDVEGFSKVSISHKFETVVPGFLPSLSEMTALSTDACFPNQPA
ncbi:TadE/TadG family type IV pilus assembly protein [Nitratireductor luteus]|uniref:TadE/TadG family type IV pilus assembly protein n=1 Tax=Nitratireductor luteus TaxID=2976980 RepID=UPI0022400190|nr:TadE family protein [Nitratireductor luteus]